MGLCGHLSGAYRDQDTLYCVFGAMAEIRAEGRGSEIVIFLMIPVEEGEGLRAGAGSGQLSWLPAGYLHPVPPCTPSLEKEDAQCADQPWW